MDGKQEDGIRELLKHDAEHGGDDTYGSVAECPWCHKYLRDSSELFGDGTEEVETDCGYCKKPIVIIQTVSVDYTVKTRST